MNKKQEQNDKIGELLKKHTDLKGEKTLQPKVGVGRVSYKVSESSLNNLTNLKEYYNCSTKEMIDAIFDDEVLIENILQIFSKVEDEIIIYGTRKTFVVSENTKQRIDHYASREKVSKELVFNTMITGFFLAHRKTLENHKWAKDKLLEFWNKIDELQGELSTKLSLDDPIIHRTSYMHGIIDEITRAIDNELENNIAIDFYN